jgi:phage tail-like protein
MAFIQPALNFNFVVALWNVEASLFGSSALGMAAQVAASLLMGGFSEVQGLNAEFDIETYDEGGRADGPHRFVKRTKFPNLVFRSGVSFSPGIWDWYREIAQGSGPRTRKSGLIILMDRGGFGLESAGPGGLGRIPIAAWTFTNAYPEKLQGPTLNARGNEVAIETLELSHEGIERVSPTMIPGLGSLGL